jgi:hypothetical protein
VLPRLCAWCSPFSTAGCMGSQTDIRCACPFRQHVTTFHRPAHEPYNVRLPFSRLLRSLYLYSSRPNVIASTPLVLYRIVREVALTQAILPNILSEGGRTMSEQRTGKNGPEVDDRSPSGHTSFRSTGRNGEYPSSSCPLSLAVDLYCSTDNLARRNVQYDSENTGTSLITVLSEAMVTCRAWPRPTAAHAAG